MKKICEKIKNLEDEFIEIRRYLHQNPEVGFEEIKTSKLVADKLKEWGYTVHEKIGKTGVVGQLKVGDGEKVIALRADMDALPIQEEINNLPWRSKNEGKLHGCGHDGHTAILLCAAKYLAETKNFNGTVNVVFQPAEEILFGAKAMIDDNFFERFLYDYIFGLHNMPGDNLEKGGFYFKKGSFMASSDILHIDVHGVGCHGAHPENGIDATVVACYITIALQSIISRNVSPLDQAVVTVGCIESGKAANVVNDRALMKVSVRALRNDIRDKVLKRIDDIVQLQAKSFGATATINHINACPALENPADGFDLAVSVATELYGEDKVHLDATHSMGSEDFAFFFEKHPRGNYVFVGSGAGFPVHSPQYDFNDDLIGIGAAYWAALVEKYLL